MVQSTIIPFKGSRDAGLEGFRASGTLGILGLEGFLGV